MLDNATATVTFDANGGSGSMANQTSTSQASLSANAFTRSGYTFSGWNTAADGSGTSYAEGGTYPFSSNTTLFAQWTALPSAEFVAVTPKRLFDTRGTTPLTGGASGRQFVVVGSNGVPADASAVVLNVTVTRPAADGFLTLYPCGQDRPNTSTVNFAAGRDVANSVTVQVGQGGAVCVYSSADADVVIDVNGAYSSSEGAAHLLPLAPARLFDTRADGARLAASTPKQFVVADAGG
ncbi:MAG: InlB B-repeat-containing protein, partial [Ilumatobacteraceae bacterium]